MATITFKNEYDGGGRKTHLDDLDFVKELLFYAIIAIFLMVIVLVIKLLWECEGNNGEERPTESSGLLSSKEEALFSSYGSTDEDIESAWTMTASCSSSSEDLYDGKICVICYDDQRNCFFNPCGHCISCYNCAERITSEDKKRCPICRTIINKVTMIHIL